MLWWTLPSLAGTVIGVWVAQQTRHHMRPPASLYLSVTAIMVVWWCITQWTSMLWINQDYRLFLAKLQYLAISSVPVAWLFTALAFCGLTTLIRRWYMLFCAIPLITLVLVFTNEYHGQIWQSFAVVPGSLTINIEYGPWFSVHALYAYCAVITGTLLIANRIGFTRDRRLHLMAIIAAPLIVLLVNLTFILGIRVLPIDPTPTAFAVASVLLLYALRSNALAVVAVARRIIFDKLSDGVIVIDDHGRVADHNSAAAELLAGKSLKTGILLHDFLDEHESLYEPQGHDVKLDNGTWLNIRISPVETLDGPLRGQVVILRDISPEKALQDSVQAAQDKLQTLNNKLHVLAHTDELTGLANRRRLYERLSEEWARSQRQHAPLSIILMDYDHFKSVNDSYGHQTGDRVLKESAKLIQQLIRPQDLAARHGGEELAVMLPGADLKQAGEVAQRLQHALRNMRYETDSHEAFSVTVSFGLACRESDDHSLDDLIARADSALYHSKNTGRDAISICSGSDIYRLDTKTE